jgi:hypothetical protein
MLVGWVGVGRGMVMRGGGWGGRRGLTGDDNDLILDPPVFKVSEPFIPQVEFVIERLTVLSSLELPL